MQEPQAALTAAAEAMRALADETRLHLLQVLVRQPLCVCDLASEVGVSQPLVSHHLKTLKGAGLVACRHEGARVYYAVRTEAFRDLGLESLWRPGALLGPPAEEA